ncbi:uncharacterized protein LOC130788029 isoform X2 [Actinidia eriantha]|uniref:uncharacterized protein LOC130788029 isoform X2 n=1 Tax=Actinidia eriantha TaxID=165200 RepID=UPI00258C1D07|nr:uncharacterized protein LOC130788029 isoform X2 [Actinidia eriantha]
MSAPPPPPSLTSFPTPSNAGQPTPSTKSTSPESSSTAIVASLSAARTTFEPILLMRRLSFSFVFIIQAISITADCSGNQEICIYIFVIIYTRSVLGEQRSRTVATLQVRRVFAPGLVEA